MRGLASQSVVKAFEKQFNPIQKWGGIASLEPKKNLADEKVVEPVAAFSRPPPYHPFFETFIAFTFLDSWSKQDSKDDA